jgi:twinkle protein
MSNSRLDEIVHKLESVGLPDVDFESYYKSHEDDTRKIRKLVDYYDDINDFVENGDVIHGAKLPFKKLEDKFRFRGGEVTLWTGFNGHKKSMLLGFVSNGFLAQGESVCIASFEMKPISTIERMTRQYTHKEKAGYDEFADYLTFAGNHLFIFDQQGGMTPSRLLGVILYAAQNLGVKHFVIDSLMRVIDGEDKYNEQKDFVVKLCEVAIKTNTHIHLVHHTKKGKESEPSGRYDAKGSGAISDNVHNSLIVWSNKDKQEHTPDVILKCDKQRAGAWEGSLALDFDNASMCFMESYTYSGGE